MIIEGIITYLTLNKDYKVNPSIFKILNNGTTLMVKSSKFIQNIKKGVHIKWKCKQINGEFFYEKDVHVEITFKKRNNLNDYGVQYGTLINYSRDRIQQFLESYDISRTAINDMLTKMEHDGDNINAELYKYSDALVKVKFTYAPEEINRIALIWRYGLSNKKFGTKNNILDKFIELWRTKGVLNQDDLVKFVIRLDNDDDDDDDDSTKEANDKRSKTDDGNEIKIIWKNLLFTGIRTQLFLLGMAEADISKIYKMNDIDRYGIMGSLTLPLESQSNKLYSPMINFNEKHLFYRLLANPYAFYKLDMTVADTIITSSFRNLDNFKDLKQLGVIARNVWSNVDDDKWTYCPKSMLNKEFSMDDPIIKNYLVSDYGLIYDDDRIYIKYVYYEELYVAQFFHNNISLNNNGLDNTVYHDSQLDPEQNHAVNAALNNSLTIITGSAGTGKTKIIKSIVSHLKRKDISFRVCALTGKAVDRIRDVLGSDLSKTILHAGFNEEYIENICTIHSLIYRKDSSSVKYIIIDEGTMVNLALMNKLLKIYDNKSVSLVLLGDVNQLSPLKYGKPFEELIKSECGDIIRLKTNHRQSNNRDDFIIENSLNIIKGRYIPKCHNNFDIYGSDQSPDFLLNIVRKFNITIDTIDNHKFITPKTATMYELNNALSPIINPSPRESRNITISYTKTDYNTGKTTTVPILIKFSIGDPVIFMKNGVYKDVFNGSEGTIIGFIVKQDKEDSKRKQRRIVKEYILVNVNGYIVKVPIFSEGEKLTVESFMLAYAITTHKSQGSEWKNIYCVIQGKPWGKFLHKRMTYTMITRAKSNCVVIEYDPDLFTKSSNTEIKKYYDYLGERVSKQSKRVIISNNHNTNQAAIKLN